MTDQQIFIPESGMEFGPYHEDQCFYIEKSQLYKSIKTGVQMAEFLFLKNDPSSRLLILDVVEAKSSSPQPGGQEKFDDFIRQIRDKFVNAFSLCWATCLERHPKFHRELPKRIREMDLSQVRVRFVLVIKGHRDDWLSPIHDELNKTMRPTLKTWGFSHDAVIVFNDEMARQFQYIV